MNTNKGFTEVELFCFQHGKCLVRRNNRLTVKISEYPTRIVRRDKERECVFVFAVVLILVLSLHRRNRRQQKKEAKGFLVLDRTSSSRGFILFHFMLSASR